MKRFFKIGNIFGILGLSGLRHKGRIQKRSNRVVYQKTKDLDLEVRSQVSGYGKLKVGIDKKGQNHQQWFGTPELTILQYKQQYNCFCSQSSFASKVLVIQIFMKESRPVVTEKRVFVSRDESKLLPQFGSLGLSQIYFHNSTNTKNNF